MKKGDWVSVIDEDLEGRITNIVGDTVFIDADGFDMEFLRSQLVEIPDNLIDRKLFSDTSIPTVIAEKETDDRPFIKRKSTKRKEESLFVVDLHEQHLNTSIKGKTKHDILNLQIDLARHKLEFAIRKKIQKVIFIHGVGQGVLKMELETLFGRYDNVKYYDADFKTYGLGATEVYIYQNA